MFESIKEDKVLSFSHWRYRLLHWAFNVQNPNPAETEKTGLPKFLYTHYCPLFHLTNLIALLSPLILAVKLVGFVCKNIYSGVCWLYSKMPAEAVLNSIVRSLYFIGSLFPRFPVPNQPVQQEAPPPNRELLRDKERKACIRLLCTADCTFSEFYASYGPLILRHLTENEVREIYDNIMPKVLAAREKARLRREKWKHRIIFCINISRVFIKWTLNIAYIGLGLALAYLVYISAVPIYDGLCYVVKGIVWFFSGDNSFWDFLFFLAKSLVIGTVFLFTVALIIKGIARTGLIQKGWNKTATGVSSATSPPLQAVSACGKWVYSGFREVVEFVKMFYEENCPAVKLVSEEEEMVDRIANNRE